MVLSAGNIRGYLHPLPRRNRVPELRRKAAKNPDPFRREQAYLRLASFLYSSPPITSINVSGACIQTTAGVIDELRQES